MEHKEIVSAVEGILFASGESVDISRIARCLEVSREQVERAVRELADFYSYERRGIRLLRMDDSVQLCSAPELGELIQKTLETRKPPKLSPAALETLTIVAYYQPTTRGYIEQVRGVDSSYTVGLLLDRNLICEAGTLAVPGRPKLYRTTENFLRTFGMESLDELPDLVDDEGNLLTVTAAETEDPRQIKLEMPDGTAEKGDED